MKRYIKPSLAVTRFTSQETIASNPYTSYGVTNEDVTIGGETVTVPVTTYEISSFAVTS